MIASIWALPLLSGSLAVAGDLVALGQTQHSHVAEWHASAPAMGSAPDRHASNGSAKAPLAIVNVTLVPMDTERVIPGQTLISMDGSISWIGPAAEAKLPSGARVIDGEGQFLLPGLVDMHVHIMSHEELPLYVINGVTTVRNMWGNPNHIKWREEVRSGTRVGPNLLTSGPILDGRPVQLPGSVQVLSIDEAFEAIEAQSIAGYDFLKIYNRLTPEAYDAILGVAEEFEMLVAGHVPKAVGLTMALEARQGSIEHLWGYSAALGSMPIGVHPNWSFVMDASVLATLSEQTAKSGVWNVPSLVMWEGQELSAAESQVYLKREELKLLPKQIKRFGFSGPNEASDDLDPKDRKRRRANRLSIVRGLHAAGAGLLLGTDTGNPFVLPGYGVHDEIELLMEAGLSAFEAIAAGSRNVGQFLGSDLGALVVGAPADLLLVSRNPLADPSALRAPGGVAVGGSWTDRNGLAALKQGLRTSD